MRDMTSRPFDRRNRLELQGTFVSLLIRVSVESLVELAIHTMVSEGMTGFRGRARSASMALLSLISRLDSARSAFKPSVIASSLARKAWTRRMFSSA